MKFKVEADGFDPDEELTLFALCCDGFEVGIQRQRVASIRIYSAGASELPESY